MKGSLMSSSYFIDEEDNKHFMFYVAISYLMNTHLYKVYKRDIHQREDSVMTIFNFVSFIKG